MFGDIVILTKSLNQSLFLASKECIWIADVFTIENRYSSPELLEQKETHRLVIDRLFDTARISSFLWVNRGIYMCIGKLGIRK